MISWFTPSFPRRFLFTTLSETSEFRMPTQIESSKLRELVSFWILIIGIGKKISEKKFPSFFYPPPLSRFASALGTRNARKTRKKFWKLVFLHLSRNLSKASQNVVFTFPSALENSQCHSEMISILYSIMSDVQSSQTVTQISQGILGIIKYTSKFPSTIK